MAKHNRCAIVACVSVVLLGVAIHPFVLQFGHPSLRWAPVSFSNLWYGDESVRAGTVMVRGNTHFDILNMFLPWSHALRVFRYTFLAFIGEVYLPSIVKAIDLNFLKESDPEGQFCRSLLDYFWVFPSHPMNRGTRQDMKEFVQCCREEYALLSQDERDILRPFHAVGAVPHSLLIPSQEDPEELKKKSRQHVAPYVAENITRQELEALLAESIRASAWEHVVPEAPKAVLDYYESLDIRKLPMIASDWKEIARALKEGRIAGFDATPLFPEQLFNKTPAMLAAMEGKAAERIPILSDGCTAISFTDWGRLMEQRRNSHARVHFNLADRQAMAVEPLPDVTWAEKMAIEARKGVGVEYCDTGYVHTRRIPRFHASLPDVPKMLGMEDDILRVQSYLWMGALRGGFHYDEEANLYVQLIGEADVFLVPQNYTLPITGGQRVTNPPSQAALLSDPYWKQVPFHVFRIKQGEGVTFPASTYHLFCAQSPERVAVNFFFMPKWRRMEYHEADWYYQEARRPNGGLERLALRQLWARSFSRLWDERGRSMICNAGKNEYL